MQLSRRIAIIICELTIFGFLMSLSLVNGAVSHLKSYPNSPFLVFFQLKILSKCAYFNIFYDAQMTMAQMEKTMESMRSICGPKYKLSDELIDGTLVWELLL